MPIPQTKTRLAQSLALITYHQYDDSASPIPLNPDQYRNLLKGGISVIQGLAAIKILGAAYGFRVSQERNNYMRRGINSATEPFAGAPGKVTTTIRMERAVLYSQDAMAAFSFLPGSLAFQHRPLIILESALPVESLGAAKELFKSSSSIASLEIFNSLLSPVYMGCWVNSREINYKLESDQMVTEEISLNVSRVSPLVAAATGGLVGEKILAQSVPLITRATELII